MLGSHVITMPRNVELKARVARVADWAELERKTAALATGKGVPLCTHIGHSFCLPHSVSLTGLARVRCTTNYLVVALASI